MIAESDRARVETLIKLQPAPTVRAERGRDCQRGAEHESRQDRSECPPLLDNAPHVLVVDDDQKIRELLGRYLAEHGFRVTTAADAAAARAGMRGLAFDVVLLDVMMPGENGLDLARELKATRPVPICMLTARAEPEQRIEGLEAGVDDYIPKPFEPRELLLRLRNILRRAAGAAGPHDEVRMGVHVFHVAAASCATARRASSSRSASATCCACSPSASARPSRAMSCRARIRPATTGPSTCRSTVCGARSRPTPQIRSTCKPCAAKGIFSIRIESP